MHYVMYLLFDIVALCIDRVFVTLDLNMRKYSWKWRKL